MVGARALTVCRVSREMIERGALTVPAANSNMRKSRATTNRPHHLRAKRYGNSTPRHDLAQCNSAVLNGVRRHGRGAETFDGASQCLA